MHQNGQFWLPSLLDSLHTRAMRVRAHTNTRTNALSRKQSRLTSQKMLLAAVWHCLAFGMASRTIVTYSGRASMLCPPVCVKYFKVQKPFLDETVRFFLGRCGRLEQVFLLWEIGPAVHAGDHRNSPCLSGSSPTVQPQTGMLSLACAET